jgi:CRP-like cAMP-binding protein
MMPPDLPEMPPPGGRGSLEVARVSVTAEELRSEFPDLFDGLEDASLEILAGALERQPVKGGETILRYQEPASSLFFLAKGAEVQASLPAKHGSLELGRRGAGSWVGELGVIEPGPASATVQVTHEGELWSLTADAFRDLCAGQESDAGKRCRKRDVAGRLLGSFVEDLCHRMREHSAGVVTWDTQGKGHFEHQDGESSALGGFLARLMRWGG